MSPPAAAGVINVRQDVLENQELNCFEWSEERGFERKGRRLSRLAYIVGAVPNAGQCTGNTELISDLCVALAMGVGHFDGC